MLDILDIPKKEEERKALSEEEDSILLIDHKYLMYFTFHACNNKRLGDPDIPLRYMRILFDIISNHNIEKAVVCCDTTPYARSAQFKQYKTDRRRLSEDEAAIFNNASTHFFNIIQEMSIPVSAVDRAEADDLVFHYVQRNPEKKWIVLSSDTDLVGLHSITNNLAQVYPEKFSKGGGYRYIDKKAAQELYPGFRNRFWLNPLYISLFSGHNGGLKIRGLGKITAMKMILSIPDEVSGIEEAFEYLIEASPKVNKGPPLSTYRDLIKTNLLLQTFPFPGLDIPEQPLPDLMLKPQPFMAAMSVAGIAPQVSSSLLDKIGIHVPVQESFF